MISRIFLVGSVVLAIVTATVAAWAETKGTGLPIPRFVSLRFEEVNVRTGPGTRYPIRWVYKRKYLPVEIVEEFGHWRKIKDIDGDEGWAHKSQITGARNAILKSEATLYRYPEAGAPPMLKAQEGVIGNLLECDMQWCRIQIDSYKAWVAKEQLWGVYPREIM